MSDDPYKVPDAREKITEANRNGCVTIFMWLVVAVIGFSILAEIIFILSLGW